MEPLDFLKLLSNSKALIGNSSAGLRECAYLGLPVVNIGNRQFRRSRAENVTDVSYSQIEIEKAIKMAITSEKFESSTIYGNGDAGTKIAEILATTALTFSKTITY
jgi:UDP-N-acetylglucosamine 2-epimerase